MMTELLKIKDFLQRLYEKYDMLISRVIRFAAAFVAFMLIRGMTGYNQLASNVLILILISVVCAFLPTGVTVLSGCALIILQLYEISVEFALITLAVLLILLMVYYVFAPKTGWVLLLTPVLFMLHIPYAVPVIVGLTVGISGIVPAFFGTYLYFCLYFCKEFTASASMFGDGDLVQKIVFIMDNTIMNKEMLVMGIVFAAATVLVFIIKSFSIDHSRTIAVVTGRVVEAVLVIMSHVMMNLTFNMLWLIIGCAVSVAIGLALNFFILSVDYSRTERVQFEDDDYYYYVKAVPKFNMAVTDIKIKKINSRADEKPKNYNLHDTYGADNYGTNDAAEPEDIKRRKAYEQDMLNLEDEE